jgi:hypothetical protein
MWIGGGIQVKKGLGVKLMKTIQRELARLGEQRFAKFEECLLGGNGTKIEENGCWKGNENGIEKQKQHKGECWIRMAELRKANISFKISIIYPI